MMSRITKSLMVAVCVLTACSTARSDTIYVKSGATGDGSSWADAYGLLQNGLDDADPNDEIWVAAGTYKPTSDYGLGIGDRGKHFRMINRVAIYGGFDATGDPGWLERDPNTHETILSGDIGTTGDNSDNCYHVFYHPAGTNLDPNAVLDGFTITGGNADGNSDPNNIGGGMYNVYSNPTVSNCTFTGNSTDFVGGGMYNYFYSNTMVTHCNFNNNSARYGGGGMCNSNSELTVTNCTFSENSANYYGGGMCNFYSNPTVTHCTFTGDSAAEDGGGMYNATSSSPNVTGCTFSGNSANAGGGMSNYHSRPTITNCTFYNNAAKGYHGGGMYNYDFSSPTVTHCTFSDNSADGGGGGMYNYFSSNPTVTHCIFSDNTANAGGGIGNRLNNPTVTHCKFIGNSADHGGGGISNRQNNTTVTHCTFSGNSAFWDGGGMFNYKSIPTVTGCTFTGNSADDYGGGMSNNESDPNLTNCILWGNTASSGPQIYDDGSNSTTITYSDVQGGWSDLGGNNIDSDPMFKDADGPDNIPGTVDDNLQLAYNSPCIDAGDNTAVPADTTDLDGDGDTTERTPLDLAGHARFTDDPLTADTGVPDPPDYPAVLDMGAYERYEFCGDLSQALKGDLNLDCYIDLLDFAIMASYWLQYIGPH